MSDHCKDKLLCYHCIVFTGKDECENGQVRLNGGTSTEGRVEICTQGLWTTVKSNEIAYEDAQVICKQLGFDEECNETMIL